MKQYVGLDVSQRETSVCVVKRRDRSFSKARRNLIQAPWPACCANMPHAPSGSASRPARWRAGSGTSFGGDLPVVCIDARHAHAVLSVRMNKSDQNDARGLAELVRAGWYREVKVKSEESQRIRSILVAGSRLVGIRRDIENQVRSMIKEYGLLFRRAIGPQFRKHVADLVGEGHQLRGVIEPLLVIHEQVCEQQGKLDGEVRRNRHKWQNLAPTNGLPSRPGASNLPSGSA
jgi:transposase